MSNNRCQFNMQKHVFVAILFYLSRNILLNNAYGLCYACLQVFRQSVLGPIDVLFSISLLVRVDTCFYPWTQFIIFLNPFWIGWDFNGSEINSFVPFSFWFKFIWCMNDQFGSKKWLFSCAHIIFKILRYKFHEKSKQVNLTCLGHPKCSFITFLLPTLMLGLHALQRIRARVSCKHDIIFEYFGLSRNIYHII